MGRAEAYTVNYDRGAGEQTIRDNLLYYLGEYRLGVKFAEFSYRVETDPLTNESHLASWEPGPVRNKFRNAIRVREERGLSVHREVAECLGFQKLEQALIGTTNTNNPLFVWVSPPGSQKDGYGFHSFTFVGQIIRGGGEQKIRVIPYRNILSRAEHRAYLRHFTKEAENFASDRDFLANPIIFLPRAGLETPEDVLEFIGEREKFNVDWFSRLAGKIEPLIRKYIKLVKEGASDVELIQARNAIENYTLAISATLMTESPVTWMGLKQTVPYFFKEWGREAPPPVAGSCGSSRSTLFEYHQTENKSWEYHPGNCIFCGTKDTWVGPCKICKNCEKTFDNDSF